MKSFKLLSVLVLLSLTSGQAFGMFGRMQALKGRLQAARLVCQDNYMYDQEAQRKVFLLLQPTYMQLVQKSQQPARPISSWFNRLLFGEKSAPRFDQLSHSEQLKLQIDAHAADKRWEEDKDRECLEKAHFLRDGVSIFDIMKTIPSKTNDYLNCTATEQSYINHCQIPEIPPSDAYFSTVAEQDRRLNNLFNKITQDTMFKTQRDKVKTGALFKSSIKSSIYEVSLHHGDNVNRYAEDAAGSVTVRILSKTLISELDKIKPDYHYYDYHNHLDEEQAAKKRVK